MIVLLFMSSEIPRYVFTFGILLSLYYVVGLSVYLIISIICIQNHLLLGLFFCLVFLEL